MTTYAEFAELTRGRFIGDMLDEGYSREDFMADHGLENLADDRDYVNWLKVHNVLGMHRGRDWGWYQLSWDLIEEDTDLYPIMMVIHFMKGGHEFFHPLLAELRLFESAKDAKRNGWGRRIEPGDYWFKKKTYLLRVVA